MWWLQSGHGILAKFTINHEFWVPYLSTTTGAQFLNMPLQFNPFGRSHNKGALLATAQPHSTPKSHWFAIEQGPGGPLLSSYHRYSQGTLLNSELQCPRTSEPLNYPLRMFSPGMGLVFFVHCLCSVRVGEILVFRCSMDFLPHSCWWRYMFFLPGVA